MIKYEDGNLQASGNAQELTKEWMQLTTSLIEGLSKEMECDISLQDLINGGVMLLKQEIEKGK